MNRIYSIFTRGIRTCICLGAAWAFGVTGFHATAAEHARFRPDRLIILPRPGVSVDRLAGVHLKSGRRVLKSFPALGHLQAVQLAPGENLGETALRYRESGLVEFAEPDYILRAAVLPNDPNFNSGTQWALRNNLYPGSDIHAVSGWDTLRSASNVVVAVVDSGIRYTHEDLAANMWVNTGEIPGNGIDDDRNGMIDDVHGLNAISESGDPMDDEGHGTHVAGIIGAVGNNGTGISGVAWNVQLMACKFLAADGEGDTIDAIECIDYARRMGAQVINASWGGVDYSAALYTAISRARAEGIIVVTAAGNDAENIDVIPIYPACYNLDNIVVVGASTRTDSFDAGYSSFGAQNVDLCAPGGGIYSTWYLSDRSYTTLSGTSMATPHVAGAIALMKARFPQLSSTDIIGRLLASVDLLPAFAGKCKTGGRLNLAKALGPNPTASFSASVFRGEPPLSISFTNLSLGEVQSLEWNFGDGTASTGEQDPLHVFVKPGLFDVTLTAVGVNGLTNKYAQTVRVSSNYEFVPETYSWIEPAGMTPLSLSDNGYSAQSLPFRFPFYEEAFTNLYIGANGLIGFASAGLDSSDNTSIPNLAAPNGMICPYWDNLNPAAGGSVYAGVIGEAPNRRFVASWVNVFRNSSTVPMTFQAVLEEATGEIVFQYLNVQPQSSRGGAKRATVGVEAPTGDTGALYTYNGTPTRLQNETAIRVRPRGYDYLLTHNSSVSLTNMQGGFAGEASVVIENAGNKSLAWSMTASLDSLVATPSQGILAGNSSVEISLSLNAPAALLNPGDYYGILRITNETDGAGSANIPVTLHQENARGILEVTIQSHDFSGGLGGPFAPSNIQATLKNVGTMPVDWNAFDDSNWLEETPAFGLLAAGATANVTFSLTSEAIALPSGTHDASLFFTGADGVSDGPAVIQEAIHLSVNARIEQSSVSIVDGQFRAQLPFPGDAAIIVEASDDLKTWVRSDLTPLRNGSEVSFEDAMGGEHHRFYRLRTE